jgi:outer membrane protein assembly factor BamB
MSRILAAAISFVGVLIAPLVVVSQDWPQWRGPARDGAGAFSVPASWPESLQQKWRVEVGLGYATPILVGNRIYIFTRQGEDEVMQALDATSGKSIWRTSYPAPFQMISAAARHREGPKSTPTFAAGRLFTLGMSGIFTAFDAETGRQLWQKPASSAQPMFHTGMSPVVDGNLVIIHLGGPGDTGLMALDTATGNVRWRWDGDSPAYGSPMVVDLAGTRQVVTFTHQNMVGVSLATGELLWRRPFVTPSNTTSQTPIFYRDTVIQAGRNNGITAFRAARGDGAWTTQDLWHTDNVSLHLTNGVAIDGVLYGLSHLNSGQYFALDLSNGQVLWTSEPRQAENAAMVRAGNSILSIQNDAKLVVINANRMRFDPVRRYEIATSETWAQPAISGNRMFVKDVTNLTLWTLN